MYYRVFLKIGAASPLSQVVSAHDCRDACAKVLIPKHNVQCVAVQTLDTCEELETAMARAEQVLNQYQREARGVRSY